MDARTERLAVRTTKELKEEVIKIADANGMTISGYIANMLKDAVALAKRKSK
jgi:antitoxin component of RelBE/YafQ-DinJ toxin-antitoxin module